MTNEVEKRIAIGKLTIEDVEGTPEELVALKELIDEVSDKCYPRGYNELFADLANQIQQDICSCTDKVICREVRLAIERWAHDKLDALRTAESLVGLLDEFELQVEDDEVEGLLYETGPTCDTSEKDFLKYSHTSVPESMCDPSATRH